MARLKMVRQHSHAISQRPYAVSAHGSNSILYARLTIQWEIERQQRVLEYNVLGFAKPAASVFYENVDTRTEIVPRP